MNYINSIYFIFIFLLYFFSIRIYEIELRLGLAEQYKFPAFESWQWRAAIYYGKLLKQFNSESKSIYYFIVLNE